MMSDDVTIDSSGQGGIVVTRTIILSLVVNGNRWRRG